MPTPKPHARYLLAICGASLLLLAALYIFWDAPAPQPLPEQVRQTASSTCGEFLRLDLSELERLFTKVHDRLFDEDLMGVDELPSAERNNFVSEFDRVAEDFYPKLFPLLRDPSWQAPATSPNTSPSVLKLHKCLRFVKVHQELKVASTGRISSDALALQPIIAKRARGDAHTLIGATMAMGLSGMAVYETAELAPRATPSDVLETMRFLLDHPIGQEFVGRALRDCDRAFRRQTTNPDWVIWEPHIDTPTIQAPFLFFKPNASRHLHHDVIAAWIGRLGSPIPVRPPDVHANVQRFHNDRLRPLKSNNPLGEAMVATSTSVFEQTIGMLHRIRCNYHLTVTYLAILLYYDHHGELPTSLEDLLPAYLKDIPTDPYSDEPLRYDPASLILWSVGTDGLDEGGAPQDRHFRPTTEPTLKITLPIP